MTTDEKIIKYLDNEFSAEERKAFEEELIESDLLREQLDNFLKVKSGIDLSKNYNLSQAYFDSILPKFRNKLNNSESVLIKKNLSLAFGMMVVIIASVIVFNQIFNNSNEITNLQQFTESLDEQQKIELLENLNGEVEEYYQIAGNDLSFTELIQNELVANNEIAEVYDINYVELIDQLNPGEADKVYYEILNTNFNEVQL